MTRFEECLPLLLAHEGDWSDDPNDPGGATMKGVTLQTYSAWLGRQATKEELRDISDDDLAAIYETEFWLTANCDQIPAGPDYFVFDYSVNSGPSRARKAIQTAAGVTADGVLGPQSMAAIHAASPLALIESMSAAREAYYRSLPTFSHFGKGWMNRLNEVTAQAKAFASQPPETP